MEIVYPFQRIDYANAQTNLEPHMCDIQKPFLIMTIICYLAGEENEASGNGTTWIIGLICRAQCAPQ